MSRTSFAFLLALSTLFVALTVPPIFGRVTTMPQYRDMVDFHLPQINYLVGHPFNIVRYETTSATTPGHHILFAWVSIFLGYDHVTETDFPLRLLNVLVGLAFVVIAFQIFHRFTKNGWAATALAVPIATSNYVVAAAIWINTDNGAYAFYGLGMFLLLFHQERYLLASTTATLMLLWRQIYLPVVGAYLLPSAFSGNPQKKLPVALLVILPSLLVFGAYALAWGGVTPTTARNYNKFAFSFAVPLHAFALTGLWTCPYTILLWPALSSLTKRRRLFVALVGFGVALAMWLASASTYDNGQGRWGSLVWVLAKMSPAIGDHTLVTLLLAALGVGVLFSMGLIALHERYFPVELAMLLCYFGGYSAQVFAWQRYIEPAIFLTVGVFVARRHAESKSLGYLGPVALALLFAVMGQLRVWGVAGRLFG